MIIIENTNTVVNLVVEDEADNKKFITLNNKTGLKIAPKTTHTINTGIILNYTKLRDEAFIKGNILDKEGCLVDSYRVDTSGEIILNVFNFSDKEVTIVNNRRLATIYTYIKKIDSVVNEDTAVEIFNDQNIIVKQIDIDTEYETPNATTSIFPNGDKKIIITIQKKND